LTHGRAWYLGLAALLACGGPTRQKRAAADTVTYVPATDSLVLTNSAGVEIWFTLTRPATGADGRRCVERGLEIRQGGKRVQVPLLYTGAPPVLLNDSTLRAMLWTHCQPSDAYRVSLRSGQPVRERTGAAR
jgi:hypothetical protein